MGEGLQQILRLYGRMVIQGELWLWDYAKETAVKAKNMRDGSTRHANSERARAEMLDSTNRCAKCSMEETECRKWWISRSSRCCPQCLHVRR
jgi:hypothetical protein